jgi:hypothetical protein
MRIQGTRRLNFGVDSEEPGKRPREEFCHGGTEVTEKRVLKRKERPGGLDEIRENGVLGSGDLGLARDYAAVFYF